MSLEGEERPEAAKRVEKLADVVLSHRKVKVEEITKIVGMSI